MKNLVVLLAILFSGSAFAAKPYTMQGVVLLQPESVLRARVKVADLSSYIQAVTDTAEKSLADTSKAVPTAGFIVIAVRPGGQSKVWLDFSPKLPVAAAARLRFSLEKVPPFPVKEDVVVFALKSSFWGAAPTVREMPSPTEWNEAAKSLKNPIEIGELVERAWPKASSNNSLKEKKPRFELTQASRAV